MSTKDAQLCACGHTRRLHRAPFTMTKCLALYCDCRGFMRARPEHNTFVSTGRGRTAKGAGPHRERGDS